MVRRVIRDKRKRGERMEIIKKKKSVKKAARAPWQVWNYRELFTNTGLPWTRGWSWCGGKWMFFGAAEWDQPPHTIRAAHSRSGNKQLYTPQRWHSKTFNIVAPLPRSPLPRPSRRPPSKPPPCRYYIFYNILYDILSHCVCVFDVCNYADARVRRGVRVRPYMSWCKVPRNNKQRDETLRDTTTARYEQRVYNTYNIICYYAIIVDSRARWCVCSAVVRDDRFYYYYCYYCYHQCHPRRPIIVRRGAYIK